MASEARLYLVKEMLDEFVTRGRTDLLLEHIAEDVAWRTTAPAGTALGERFVGREGVMEYFRRVDELVSTAQLVVSDYFQSGDKLVAVGSERLCVRRSGREQVLDWAMVMSFRQDRIAEILVIEDLSILLADG